MVKIRINDLREMVKKTPSSHSSGDLQRLEYGNWFAVDALTGDVWIAPIDVIVSSYEGDRSNRLVAISEFVFPVFQEGVYLGFGTVNSDIIHAEKESYEGRTMPDMSAYEKVELVW